MPGAGSPSHEGTGRGRGLCNFKALFDKRAYLHRRPGNGDTVAFGLIEDLVASKLSTALFREASRGTSGIASGNARHGITVRRGDGTFGRFVPGTRAYEIEGSVLKKGMVSTVDIGIEVKILNKAMIKQVHDRIAGLQQQAEYFKRGKDRQPEGNPVTIAVIGVNHASYTVGYEGERTYRTDGKKERHPCDEGDETVRRLKREVAPHYDEVIIIPYEATNEDPFPFRFKDETALYHEWDLMLSRVSAEYNKRNRDRCGD